MEHLEILMTEGYLIIFQKINTQTKRIISASVLIYTL